MNEYKGVPYNELYGKIYPKVSNYKDVPIETVYFTKREFMDSIDKIDENINEKEKAKASGKEWLDYDWFYVKNVKELKESLKSVPDDTEVKLDSRLVLHLPSNKYILQFRKHDFS